MIGCVGGGLLFGQGPVCFVLVLLAVWLKIRKQTHRLTNAPFFRDTFGKLKAHQDF